MPSRPERAAPTTAVERSIGWPGGTLAYRLRRSRRRTIGLTIDRHGLMVGAPHSALIREIEAVLLRHQTWISGKLAAWAERATQAPPVLRACDGALFPLLGMMHRLVLQSGTRQVRWLPADGPDLPLLHLSQGGGSTLARRLEQALRTRARAHFAERLAYFAPQLDLAVPPLALSSAKTRWGSCNARGEIRLNWRLIHFSPDLVDYVVVHELAHCHEMNHGPRFWSHVGRLLPNWPELRRSLRQQAATCPVIEENP